MREHLHIGAVARIGPLSDEDGFPVAPPPVTVAEEVLLLDEEMAVVVVMVVAVPDWLAVVVELDEVELVVVG